MRKNSCVKKWFDFNGCGINSNFSYIKILTGRSESGKNIYKYHKITGFSVKYEAERVDYAYFINDNSDELLTLTDFVTDIDGDYSNEAYNYIYSLDFKQLNDLLANNQELLDKLFTNYSEFELVNKSESYDDDESYYIIDKEYAEICVKYEFDKYTDYSGSATFVTWNLYGDALEATQYIMDNIESLNKRLTDNGKFEVIDPLISQHNELKNLINLKMQYSTYLNNFRNVKLA